MIRLLEAFDLFKDLVLSIYRNKLVGRAESIHQQRKWRYRFSDYTTGRVGDFPVFGKASTEIRDRTLARIVPRSR